MAAMSVSLAACGNDDGGGGGPLPTATAPPVPTATMPPPLAGTGLIGEVQSASIAADGTLTVAFILTDAEGTGVTPVLASTQDPQKARVRFTVAHVESYSGGGDLANTFLRYINDVNNAEPAYDSNGMLRAIDAAAGSHEYVFRAKIPTDYDPAETYSIGMQANRTFEGESFAVNQVFDFVPAGGEPIVWTDTSTQQCNSCHNPLRAHGSRYEIRLCTLCHTEAATDDDHVPIDFRVMIHKIHRGVNLPSVVDGPPGANYTVAGETFAEKHEDGSVTGVAFPRAIQNCVVCHDNAPTAEFHRTKPSTAACTACHDDVNPGLETTQAGEPGTNHFQERGYPDGECNGCHEAEQGREYDITVPGAHVVPEHSSQLKGLNLDILGVSNHGAGETPTFDFKVTENDGTALTNLSGLNRVAFTVSGPTSDYEQLFTFTAVGGGATGMLSGPDSEGVFQYMASAPIPSDAEGTWAVGSEARRAVELETTPEVSPKEAEEAAVNQVVTFSVDDSEAEVRRMVVEDGNCNVCHGEFSKDFSVHGNLRNRIEYCVLCHNPTQSDFARRRRDPEAVAAASPVATIDFKVLIHKIHRGEDLAQKPYIVYGFGPAPANFAKHDFSEVRFPGDLTDCESCHLPETSLIPPFPGTAQGTLAAHLNPADGSLVVDGVTGPITSACLSCHDGDAAIAHAQTQTAPDGAEACEVCHSEGRLAPVSAAHAGELGE
jgi:OmcA/MtrC family decaheme c-type cytochrome